MSEERSRQEELEAMSGHEIRRVAQQYGINKPESGQWKDAIGSILEFEGSREAVPATSEPVEPTPDITELGIGVATKNLEMSRSKVGNPASGSSFQSNSETSSSSSKSKQDLSGWIFSKEYYDQLNQPRCPLCGEKKRTNFQGQQICATSNPDCPFVPQK